MNRVLFFLICVISNLIYSQSQEVKISNNNGEQKLEINGKPFIINGMNWDYFPIGENYNYSLWTKSDDFIKKALNDEMSLLKNMNVNTIRVYTGIPKKWITYII